MSKVTIKGRVSTTYLTAGEVATVEYTDTVQGLIDRGYVKVLDASQASVSLTGVVTPHDEGDRASEEQLDTSNAPSVPKKSASKAEWVEFLTDQGIEVGEDDTRDDLVDHWHLVDRG